jgi:HAD superfamily hydrolase (TIGR01662 family)
MIKLIAFDVDGTLVPFESTTLLPGVAEWFAKHGPDYTIALVSNAGGVSLRLWMESGGFGDPESLPTEAMTRERLATIQAALIVPSRAYLCFAYQSKKSGKWSPTPEGRDILDPEWDPAYRKPAPGMLLAAMADAGCEREETLFVGDWAEDEAAAVRAGCAFAWANEFFGR